MYCKYCGYQLPDDAQFCPNCGKQNPNPVDRNLDDSKVAIANESQQTKSNEIPSSKTLSSNATPSSSKTSSLNDVGQKKNGLFSKRIVIIAAVAIVVLIAIIVSVVMLSGGGQATIHIDSDPSGAEVYLNDKYSGFTPLTIDVSPGTEYVISIKDSEYEIWEQVVASYQSGTKTVNANLRPL